MTTHPTHHKNEEAVRRRFLRALAELGLQQAVPANSITIDHNGLTITGLSVGQLALLTNALEDVASTVEVAEQELPQLVGGLTQPERLPVSFTSARISPQAVLS